MEEGFWESFGGDQQKQQDSEKYEVNEFQKAKGNWRKGRGRSFQTWSDGRNPILSVIPYIPDCLVLDSKTFLKGLGKRIGDVSSGK